VKHSWTGGQYSVWRALLAIALATALDSAISRASGAGWQRLLAAALAVALALGWKDRIAAALLAAAWWLAQRRFHWGDSPGMWAIPMLLLLHASTHGSPYGSLDALGRADPAGGWILPRWNFAARRLLVLGAAVAGVLQGGLEMPACLAAAGGLSAFDPGWIAPRRSEAPARVFYDGSCGLCHRFVRFLLAEDRTGLGFRFAPLEGDSFRAAFPPEVRKTCPDSIVVKDEQGRAQVRSRAVALALARLGGLWRAIAVAMAVVPRPLLDLGYDGVARVRRRIFARPEGVCPLVPAHLLRRFDP